MTWTSELDLRSGSPLLRHIAGELHGDGGCLRHESKREFVAFYIILIYFCFCRTPGSPAAMVERGGRGRGARRRGFSVTVARVAIGSQLVHRGGAVNAATVRAYLLE
ncbi:MAG: hypothetical protein ACK4N4_12590 [Burkholderiales bacterium]